MGNFLHIMIGNAGANMESTVKQQIKNEDTIWFPVDPSGCEAKLRLTVVTYRSNELFVPLTRQIGTLSHETQQYNGILFNSNYWNYQCTWTHSAATIVGITSLWLLSHALQACLNWVFTVKIQPVNYFY